MPIVNKPDMSYGTWAENGNIEIPSSEKVEEGWGVEKPLNETMNWLQNRQDRMLQYINQRGIPEWDFRTEYPIGAYTVRAGNLYKSLSQNTDADPTLNTEIWFEPFASKEGLSELEKEIDKVVNQSGYLSHYVLKNQPVMTSIAKGVGYANSDGKSSFGFVSGKPTIKNNNQVVATFSGGSENDDVVTHGQLSIKLQSYLVGDIYLTTSSEEPQVRFGYGTWERFGQGLALVGFSTSVSNETPQWVKTAGSVFGEYDHELTEEEIPEHDHPLNISRLTKIAHDSSQESDRTVDVNGDPIEGYVGSAGGGEAHNNVQPSIVVYMWKRIA